MSIRFSVLLPTRNGGEFLDHSIRSILSNTRDDIELIVSSNANTDSTDLILSRWSSDKRLKVIYQKDILSVTDNWNATLNEAVGEYVLMMGDDDCLLPNYFDSMSMLIDKYEHPDCILYNALSYIAPFSIGTDQVNSYYSPQHFRYGPEFKKPFILDERIRTGIVTDMFDFNVRIPLNMQTTLVRRDASTKITGGLFQPPFPDHFALNAMLLVCKTWLFTPETMVIVGVSPKSFGHFVYSQKQESGLSYLGISPKFAGQLPGNELLNGMHIWLTMLIRAYGDRLQGIGINRSAYVRRQVYAWIMQVRLDALSWRDCLKRLWNLDASDQMHLVSTVTDLNSWRRLFRIFQINKKDEVGQQWQGLKELESIKNISEFAAWYQNTQQAH